jgi:dephospho-CoA kinase
MGLSIGLTGGIASGKSTVSSLLIELGFPVIDADQIAREAVKPGEEPYKKIVETFGREILLENGEINRPKLGSIIFHDQEKRDLLNKIVHPFVRRRMIEQKEALFEKGEKAVILDIPLLFESKLTHLVDKTILVYVDADVQLERLMRRNDLTENEAKARIASQMPLVQKVPLADTVINNNGTIEETRKQLIHVLTNWQLL